MKDFYFLSLVTNINKECPSPLERGWGEAGIHSKQTNNEDFYSK